MDLGHTRTRHLHHDPKTKSNASKQAIFEARYSSNDQPRSIDWFMDTFLTDTIPAHARKGIIAVSLDWTPMPTWAVTLDYRIEEEIRKEQEPEDTGEIGTLDQRATGDPKRRRRRSGRASHRHQQNLRRTVLPATTDTCLSPPAAATWNGNPFDPKRRGAPTKNMFPTAEPFPPNNDNALNGLHAVLVALENFPNLEDIIADIGYTIYGEAFVRPLHRLGISVVMDYDERRPKDNQDSHDRIRRRTSRYCCSTAAPSS